MIEESNVERSVTIPERMLRALEERAAEPMPPAIAKAIAIAQSKIRRVGHDAKNAHHQYRYTSAEAVIEACIGPMSEAGLGLVQMGWDRLAPVSDVWCVIDDKGQTLELRETSSARLRVRYLLVHESGASWELPAITIPVLPEKGRPLDKAEATALTYSLGYTLRGLLRVPRAEGDDDADQRDDRNVERERPQRAPQKAPPQKTESDADRGALVDATLALYAAAKSEADLEAAKDSVKVWWKSRSKAEEKRVSDAAAAARVRVSAATATSAATAANDAPAEPPEGWADDVKGAVEAERAAAGGAS